MSGGQSWRIAIWTYVTALLACWAQLQARWARADEDGASFSNDSAGLAKTSAHFVGDNGAMPLKWYARHPLVPMPG